MHLLQERQQKYEFIKSYNKEFTVEKMCKVFKVSTSSYYDWLNRKPSATKLENTNLKKLIQLEYTRSRNRYGSPKITTKLNNEGVKVSRQRVGRLMRSMGLKSIIQKKYKVMTTDSNHGFNIAPNHLNRNFNATIPGQKWVSDITYIPTDSGWLYLTIVMDLFDRSLIGWSMGDNMTANDTIVKAWNMAVVNREPADEIMLHSDRGVQYACTEFSNLLRSSKYNVVQSMSRKGNCWDNAVAENFFKIIKSELIYHLHFYNHKQAKQAIFEFIEVWYNRQRIHSTIGNMTPAEYYNNYFSKQA